MPYSGKEDNQFMERVVFAHLGRRTRRTRAGPGTGFDNGVVSIGGGRVMILTSDPVSVIPSFGMKQSAWLSVHLVASDYVTSGCDPEYAVFTYNFPAAMSRVDREDYVREIGGECGRLGITIAGGHSGSYPGAGFTVIGSGTMLGFAREGEYVTPAMARVGDSVLMTKGAAIEATISLATSFPKTVEASIGADLAAAAMGMTPLCSVVADARSARKAGLGRAGVSSMHDATEGGVLGALGEMAAASRKQFTVHPERVPVAPQSRAVCKVFGLDPLRTMGEGALLITCDPTAVARLRRELKHSGVECSEIGEVGEGEGVVAKAGGKAAKIVPGPDMYWAAYAKAARAS
jgi:hydrogenase maturation factor